MALTLGQSTPILNNTQVDNITDQVGVIDELPSLSLDVDDVQITRNLNQRINDSEAYWNDTKGFDLENKRSENERLFLNQMEEKGLYRHQRPYKENQIFVGEESIVSYVTSQIAGPLVIPASGEQIHQVFATQLEKAIKCYGETVVKVEELVELATRNILNKRVAIWKFHFDKNYGEHGEIILEAIDPNNVILDKNATRGSNPAFICHVLKKTPEELINEYPDKQDAILKRLGIQRKTPKQMTKEIAVREVWVTNYDQNNKPQEGVVWYFEDFVLDKIKNPNYLYAKSKLNLLRYPKKPFIFGNLVNDGTHLIDRTTPLEQAGEMQKYLNRRGRQIAENADKANGVLVISTSGGLSKDDLQNLTGDPNQRIMINTMNAGGSQESVQNLVHQLQAQVLPDYVLQDKLDARMQIGNIMGAPTDFTGSQADDGEPTLGEVMIKKNQAAGRQDMMVRAITRMLSDAYEYLVQMMIVWYTKDHNFSYDSGDGEFDFITLKREIITPGIRVKASKPANPDRSRIEATALKLAEGDRLSLLDTYKLLQLDNPQQLYDNWAKQKADPMALARDAIDVVDEAEAYVIYSDIMAGKDVDKKENPSKEFVLSLRKLMINDDFLHADKKHQRKFIKYVNDCVDSLEYRMALDEATALTKDGESLRPSAPLPDPNQPMQPPMGGPGLPMGNPPQPGMPMPPMGQPMQAGPGVPPMGPPPMGAQPPLTASSVFSGTPVPAPGQPPVAQPGNPASLPVV